MKRFSSRLVPCSWIPVLTVLLLFAEAASSQEPDDAARARPEAVEEIVVTAEKREQRLQETPISIAAFSGDALVRGHLEDVDDLQFRTPGLVVSQGGQRAQVYIRGIGSNLQGIGADQSSAFHLDGVYVSRGQAVLTNFLDVERVEVLRGPQGTLWGRNATGGSINLISKQPTSEFDAEGSIEWGNLNHFQVRSAVGGPILGEELMARVAFLRTLRDGYVENVDPRGPGDLGDEDVLAWRASFRYVPSDDFELLVSIDYTDQDEVGGAFQNAANGFVRLPPLPFIPVAFIDPATGGGVPVPGAARHVDMFGELVWANANLGPIGPPPFPFAPPSLDLQDTFTSELRDEPVVDQEFLGLNATLTWDLRSATLKSITGFRDMEQFQWLDTDGTDAFVQDFQQELDHYQVSQELQLASSEGGPLQWIGGLYYLRESGDQDLIVNLPPVTFRIENRSSLETEAWAVFGQASYGLSDRLTLTAGLRWSYEEKESVITQDRVVNFNTGRPVPPYILPLHNRISSDDDWDALTPKFGIDYRLSDDVFLYGHVTQGFKSGGVNTVSGQRDDEAGVEQTYDEEFLWAYEVGFKSTWLEDRLVVNGAAFFYDFEDLQVQLVDETTGARFLQNAAEARLYGAELELLARPLPEMGLRLGLALLDSEYEEFKTRDPLALGVLADLDGNELPNAPEWKLHAGVEYVQPLGNAGSLILNADLLYQDDTQLTPFNRSPVNQDRYSVLDARVAYEPLDSRWQFYLYGKNLTDRKYRVSGGETGTTGSLVGYGEPREVGFGSSFRF